MSDAFDPMDFPQGENLTNLNNPLEMEDVQIGYNQQDALQIPTE